MRDLSVETFELKLQKAKELERRREILRKQIAEDRKNMRTTQFYMVEVSDEDGLTDIVMTTNAEHLAYDYVHYFLALETVTVRTVHRELPDSFTGKIIDAKSFFAEPLEFFAILYK